MHTAGLGRVRSHLAARALRALDAQRSCPRLTQSAHSGRRPAPHPLAALMDESEHDVLAYMSFPCLHRAKLHSADEIDKTFALWSAILPVCDRPRGEAWRVGWKRHRAAYPVPAGLRRLHTLVPFREVAFATRQRSARSFSPHARRFWFPGGATPSRCRRRSARAGSLPLRQPGRQLHGAALVGDQAWTGPSIERFGLNLNCEGFP